MTSFGIDTRWADQPPPGASPDRTGLAFDRTQMALDRTLLAQLRTSLALITCGFVVAELFYQLRSKGIGSDAMARNFGLAMTVLGVLLLTMALVNYGNVIDELATQRERVEGEEQIHPAIACGTAPTFLIGFLLLLVGLMAMGTILARLIA